MTLGTVTILMLVVVASAFGNEVIIHNNGTNASSLSDLFGGMTLTDALLLSAILALILLLLGVMAYQRHRAQHMLELRLQARHDYAIQSLQLQTTPRETV
jgi:hypothetical protein